jgi:hypothetical protein
VGLDGTTVSGNAADKANRTLAKLQAEVAASLRQAKATLGQRRPSASGATSSGSPGMRQRPAPHHSATRC